MKHILKLSLFLLLALATALNATAYYDDITYNGIIYSYCNHNGECYAEVARQPTSFNGAAVIASSVTFVDDISGHYQTVPVTDISSYAFKNCSGLTSVSIPNSVIYIGQAVFSHCSSLTSATIPNSVHYILDYVFEYCTSLRSVTIGNSVSEIGTDMFSYCTSLRNVTIPNSVTKIYCGAFQYCSSLTSINIPNSVTFIENGAFYSCSSLTSIIIPSSVTSIANPFWDCPALASIKVQSGNTVYDSRENCDAIIESASNTLITGCQNTTIPNSVTAIGEEAFVGCSGLSSITIPNSVSIIGDYAFWNCTGLTSITIPNSVTSIATAFFGCTNLMNITCLAETPPYAHYLSFDACYSAATLYVPAGSLEAYQTTEPWKRFYRILPIEEEDEYSVTLDETNLVMEKGDVFHLKATVTPNDDYAPSVTWSSSNSNVASVNDMGFVTAEGTGTATITARAGNATATCQVRVVEHTVTLDQSEVTLPIYNTVQLHATVTPDDEYAPTVEWSSSRPGVATVSANGLVKGYMTGTATITAKVGQSTATCVVTVIPVYATGLTLSSYQEEMEVGQSTRIVAYISPSDVSNRQVSWSVTGSDVAHCSWSGNECTILAMKAGTATVTATTTDGTNLSASCQITVRGSDPIFIPVESISVRPTSVRMTVGATQQLRTIILPADATNKKVRWTSGNSSVVTVTSDGLIKALNTGTANVIARTTDGTNLSATCAVTVVAGGGGDEVLPGDVNGDGEINITDVTMLIFALLNDDFSDIDMENADVNGDGMVNITDVVTLIYNLLNGTYER